MAKVSSICLVISLCVIGTTFFTHVSCVTFRFGLGESGQSPCHKECVCYNSSSPNLAQTDVGFTVNCSGMKYGLNRGLNIPKPLPYNTTDLIITEYFLGALSLDAFNHNSFVWSPQLYRLVLRSCHIHAISTETFYSSTLQSLLLIDLNSNNIEEIHESTFIRLLKVENISIAYNRMQKLGKRTFRNLPSIKIINISHNWLKELDPETFYNVPKLEVLDLSYNWLHTLPWKKISQIPSKTLGLRGNFWNCSCQMSNILQINRSLLSGTQAVCLHPERLNGTFLEDLTPDAFSHCFNTQQHFEIKTIIIAITTLFCAIVFFVIRYDSTSGTPSESHDICIGQIMYK